jgi:hypothetical protein
MRSHCCLCVSPFVSVHLLIFERIKEAYDITLLSVCLSVCVCVLRTGAGFPPRWPELDPRSGHMGFLVDKVALRRDFV